MLRELVNEYISQLTATLVLGEAGHLAICRQELAGSEARIGPGVFLAKNASQPRKSPKISKETDI